MEFWGVEVKPGQSLKVKPEDEKILHLSQVVLGEGKKDKSNDSVTIYLKMGSQKLVLGILSAEKFPQLSYDLVFEKEFELSHNGKNASLHFCGYQTFVPDAGDEFEDSEYSSEEEEAALPVAAKENGKPGQKVEETKNAVVKANALKPESSEKPKAKLVEPSKNNDDEDDESDDDDDSDEGDSDDESDEEMDDAESDDDDDESDEDEETPKKAVVVQGKKRPNESATKTPVSAKKAKADATPQKTDGKKGGHTATPHPAAKKGGKSPDSAKSPKSGSHSCGSCKKSFNSDGALKSHNQAKHAAK